MAIITKEVEVCDICEEETEGFTYYESTVGPFGTVSENKLAIDVCKKCAYIIKNDIPKEMMIERNDDWIKPDMTDKFIKKWKHVVRAEGQI